MMCGEGIAGLTCACMRDVGDMWLPYQYPIPGVGERYGCERTQIDFKTFDQGDQCSTVKFWFLRLSLQLHFESKTLVVGGR